MRQQTSCIMIKYIILIIILYYIVVIVAATFTMRSVALETYKGTAMTFKLHQKKKKKHVHEQSHDKYGQNLF